MDSQGGTITWFLTANDVDFNAAMQRARAEARNTGETVDKELGKGMKGARISLDDFRQDLGKSAQLFRDFQIAARGFEMTSMIVGVTLAGGAIIELAGALVAATGALYTLPAMIATGVGAFATMKTATYGLGDALEAMAEGNLEKLAESMAKISPSAQEFVKSFGRINEAFKPIRKDIQERFFEGLGKEMEAVANVSLPVVRQGMLQVSTAMNSMAKEASAVMQEPFFQGMIARSFALAEENAIILTDAIRPLAMAFASLVEIGTPYTSMLSEWIVMQVELFAAYSNSAKGISEITSAINLGIDAIQIIGQLAGSVFGLLAAVFKISNDQGFSLLQTIIDILDRTTAWVESAEGTKTMSAVFEAANTVLLALAESLGTIVKLILNVIEAYNDMDDGPLKDMITNMIVWSLLFTPIITYISAVISSLNLLRFAGREAWQAMVWATPGVIKGLRMTKQGVIDLIGGFNDARVASSAFTGIAGTIGGKLRLAWESAALGLTTFRSGIAGTKVAMGGLSGVVNAVGVAIRAAFITNPIGWIVLAVTGLVAGFIYLWNNVEGFRNFFIGMWDAIVGAAEATAAWFAGPFVNFFTGAWDSIKQGAQTVSDFFVGVWDGLVAILTPVVDAFISFGQTVSDVVVTGFDALVSVITTVIDILTPLWDILSLIGAVFVGIGEIIWTVVVAAFTIIWTIISTLVQIIGVIFYGTLLKIGEAITWVFNNAVLIIQTAFAIIQAVFTTVWGAIVAFFTPILDAIVAAFTAAWNGIVAFFTPILEGIKTSVVNAFNAIKEGISIALTAVSTFITNVWNAIWAFIGPTVTTIVNFVKERFENLVANVQRIFGLIKQYIIEPVAAAIGYVRDKIGQIASSIGNAVTDAYNRVRDFVGRFTSAGRDMIDGIVNGVKQNAGRVVSYIKGVCEDALGAVKEFFGIKSPSRVMAQMGAYIMQGLGNGIKKQEQAVVGAAQHAASGVASAFSGIAASVGTMSTDFSVTGTASGSYELAPGAIDGADSIGSSTPSAVVYQTNEVYTELDMDQINRNLTWELNRR